MVVEILKNQNLVTIAAAQRRNMSTYNFSVEYLVLVHHLQLISIHILRTYQNFVTNVETNILYQMLNSAVTVE